MDDPAAVDKALFTTRVCVGGLFVGGVVFWSIVLVAIPGPPATGWEGLAAPLVFALVCGTAAILLPRRLIRDAAAQVADGSWREEAGDLTESGAPPPATIPEMYAGLFSSTRLVSAALWQAPAFFAAVVYMNAANPGLVALAAVLEALVTSRLPTRSGLVRWIDEHAGRGA